MSLLCTINSRQIYHVKMNVKSFSAQIHFLVPCFRTLWVLEGFYGTESASNLKNLVPSGLIFKKAIKEVLTFESNLRLIYTPDLAF